MKLSNIRYTDEDINNLDDYFSKEIEEYKEIEKSLIKEINKQKEELKEADEAVEYWQKECDKRSKVLDKIKDKCLENMYIDDRGEEVESIERDIKPSEILELLEEIE